MHPYRGRELRGLLHAAGFTHIEACTSCFSYGTEERVRTFGLDRAADCRDEWFVDGLTEHDLASQSGSIRWNRPESIGREPPILSLHSHGAGDWSPA